MQVAVPSIAVRPLAGARPAAHAPSYEFDRLSGVDLPLINALYNECYPFRRLAEADWFYRRNPWGEPIVWGAFNSGRLVGIRPAIPWRFCGPAGTWDAYQLIDALVAPGHRGQGLFRRMMTQTTEWAVRERVSLFSFPNANSLAAYDRLGTMQVVHSCQSAMKVLCWPRFVRVNLRLGSDRGPDAQPMGTCTEIVEDDITVTSIEQFEEDFTEVHAAVARTVGCFTERPRSFLNWRYTNAPGRAYHRALVRVNGGSCGYVILGLKHEVAHLVDVFLPPERPLLARLSRPLARFARRLGACAICFRASENNPFAAILGRRVLVKKHVQVVAMDTATATRFRSTLGDSSRARPAYFVMGDSDVW